MAGDSCDLYVRHKTPQPTAVPPPPISFFPIPISVSFGGSAQVVSPALAFNVQPASAPLSAYAARIAEAVFAHSAATPLPAGATASVNIVVADVNVPLTIGVDESYTLTFPADGSAATISAPTIFGAYMGLQTLSQAIRFDYDTEQYTVAAAPLAITDKPKFAWRGILIDTDRHWLSLHHIYRIIESLGYAKMK